MATYIYRQASSTSARSLAQAVNGRRWKRRTTPTLVAGDVVICWGEVAPTVPNGVLVVNGAVLRNKFEDARTLRGAGVATIEVSQTRPAPIAAVPQVDPAIAAWTTAMDLAEDFVEIETWSRTPVMTAGVQQLINSLMGLNTALNRPAPLAAAAISPGVWIPRMNNHVGGNDLLSPPALPNYFSKKLNLIEEYRIHSFDGRSIRAGRKQLREGYSLTGGQPGTPTLAASPWIRSFDGGWRINYDGFESTRPLRELAASAVSTLGLTFGAVDIGRTVDGTFVVLEVNRAPGLEGGSVESYAAAVTRYITEHTNGAAAATSRRAA